MLFDVIKDWGSETLVSFFVLAIFMGWLQPKHIVTRQLQAKDDLYSELKEHYDARINDLKETHVTIADDLRRTSDLNQQALGVAVDNNRKLVDQQDEMLTLARVATPALVVRTQEAQGAGPGT